MMDDLLLPIGKWEKKNKATIHDWQVRKKLKLRESLAGTSTCSEQLDCTFSLPAYYVKFM